MAGLTWVSVAATHRRQGILTELMDACHRDALERGEVAELLFASEGGIYERFGYGVATQLRTIAIDRHAAKIRPDVVADRGAVRFVEGDEAHAHRARIWEPFRRRRAGEVSRSAAWQDFLTWLWAKPEHGMGPAFCLAHDEGYAVYRIDAKWGHEGAGHRLVVDEVVALTSRAHRDLWLTLIGVDLVAQIDCTGLAIDDPLPYYFTDSRVVRTIGLRDGVWANVFEVATCFGARSYGTDDRLVLECDGVRWAIESDGGEASCRRVRTRPDLVVDHPSLGALLFGGTRPSQLVAAGRASARSDEVVRRADALFVCGPAPTCLTFF
ncbi:MAG: GNAT family N-acetyltransferase [Actinobacteria bacterium]|nr:GNAT family N-acetyltransferase [Actinomycetota bacterium]